MSRFVDLHLRPRVDDEDGMERLISRAVDLGYGCVGISLPPDVNREKISSVREVCGSLGVDFVRRVDLSPPDARALLNDLRRVRRLFEVVAVICLSKSVARQAAKDRRVDLLNFPFHGPRGRLFDRAEAELASVSSASLEIDMNPLLTLRNHRLASLIAVLRREVEIARKFEIKVVISSGAEAEFLMRQPYDYVSLATLFDLSRDSALKAVSENPTSIIERNRRKLGPEYVAPGVYVVGRSK